MVDDGLIKVVLPSTPEKILLWAQLIFLWLLAKYFISRKPIAGWLQAHNRNGYLKIALTSLVLIMLSFVLLGFNANQLGPRIILCLLFIAFCLGLPILQVFLKRRGWHVLSKRATENEILTTILFVACTGYVIAISSLQVNSVDSVIILPLTSGQLSYSLIVATSIIFLLDSGTQIVRDVLDRTGTIPQIKEKTSGAISAILFLEDDSIKLVRNRVDEDIQKGAEVDTQEFNRGKYIGNLERLLILTVVLVGSYETIGFIIAGKGLIRAKEFENRDFAEYFLIGTLTSTSLAIVIGLLLKYAMTKIL